MTRLNSTRLGDEFYQNILSDLSDVLISGVADNDFLQYNSATGLWENVTAASVAGTLDHGLLEATSLLDDDHTQYLLLAGRAGGQSAIGGTGATDTLHLGATTHGIPTAAQVTFGIGALVNSTYWAQTAKWHFGGSTEPEETATIGGRLAFLPLNAATKTASYTKFWSDGLLSGEPTWAFRTDVNTEHRFVLENYPIRLANEIQFRAATQSIRSPSAGILELDATTEIQFDIGGTEVAHIDSAGFDVTGAITVSGLVDGRDVATDGSTQDTHIADGTIHFTEGSIDHGSIAGLADDDHTQYLLADGTRALTADWNVGAFTVTMDHLAVTDTATDIPSLEFTATTNNAFLTFSDANDRFESSVGIHAKLAGSETDLCFSLNTSGTTGWFDPVGPAALSTVVNGNKATSWSNGVMRWALGTITPNNWNLGSKGEYCFTTFDSTPSYGVTQENESQTFQVGTYLDATVGGSEFSALLTQGDMELRLGVNSFTSGHLILAKTTGDVTITSTLDVTGSNQAANFISDVAIGTAPYACTSTTLNTNLNADQLDGYEGSEVAVLAENETVSGDYTFTGDVDFQAEAKGMFSTHTVTFPKITNSTFLNLGALMTRERGIRMQRAGTLVDIGVTYNVNAQGTGASGTFEIHKWDGAVETTLTSTIAFDLTSTGDKDAGVGPVARTTAGNKFDAGDIISVYATTAGAPVGTLLNVLLDFTIQWDD